MLDVQVRFEEKVATVRYVPGKATLEQIVQRYEGTPFGVSPLGAAVTIARGNNVTLRGWSQRISPPPGKEKTKEENELQPIELTVEWVPSKDARLDGRPRFTLSHPPARGLASLSEFKSAPSSKDKTESRRQVARLSQTIVLDPGEITVPVGFHLTAVEKTEKRHELKGELAVVVPIPRPKPSADPTPAAGVDLIGGALQLRLGHLCDQKGCVDHFYRSLKESEFAGVAGVRPWPSLKDPRATVYLRSRQAVDLWNLREGLRDRGVEIAAMSPRDLGGHRLRVELPRWRADAKSSEIQQCLSCREETLGMVKALGWAKDAAVAGGGINFRAAREEYDVVELLDSLARSGTAPLAVWLVPDGVALPKPPAPPLAEAGEAKKGGSFSHPVVEMDFAHSCGLGEKVLAMLERQKWTSRTQVAMEESIVARASIADRSYAPLTPLLKELRAAGHVPRAIRLRNFGDLRLQLEFAHICGPVEYSKPPKSKKKTSKKKPAAAAKDAKPEKKKDAKPEKPFVPKPLRPAASSNGRKAIEAAIASVKWIKGGVFHGYHTRFEFRGGPTKIRISLEVRGEDVVRLDELLGALRAAGFPPKSVTVSRLFAGVPFAKPLPGDLVLADGAGKKQPLASLKKPSRPLALALVSLNCQGRKKYKDYKPDPKFYSQLNATIGKFKDRVDFVAVSANPKDKFADVAHFWQKTGLSVPLLHDADGKLRAVLNAQEVPAPHIFLFDAGGLFRYAGEPHNHWAKPKEKKDDYLSKALDLVLAGKYQKNGSVFYNKSLCNCSDPNCKCPKCGCGPSCRCALKH